MAISEERLEALRAAMNGLELPNSSLDRAIALGIRGQGGDAWLVLSIQDCRVNMATSRRLARRENVDDQLEVAVAVLGTEATWIAVGAGGAPRVIQAADQREFDVSGQLSYFIRHVRSVVHLLAAFGERFGDGEAA